VAAVAAAIVVAGSPACGCWNARTGLAAAVVTEPQAAALSRLAATAPMPKTAILKTAILKTAMAKPG
jgi:hypothetical protein